MQNRAWTLVRSGGAIQLNSNRAVRSSEGRAEANQESNMNIRWLPLLCAMAVAVSAGCGGNGGPTGPEQPPATVTFMSTPAGATVYFDGDSVGVTYEVGVDTLRVEDVAWGPHTYELVLEGYKTINRHLNIVRGNVVAVTWTLELLLSVEVITSPEGATVRLDGEQLRDEQFELRHTPLTVEGLTAGKHEVALSFPGYFTQTGWIELTEEHPHSRLVLELVRRPEVVEMAFFVATNAGEVVDVLSPFPARYFEFDWQMTEMYFVWVGIRFEGPLPERMGLRAEVFLKTTQIATETVYVSQGVSAQGINLTDLVLTEEWWMEASETGYYMESGAYTVSFWYGNELVTEGSFEIL